MQIQIVQTNTPLAFNAALYPEQHQNTQLYIQSKLQALNETLGQFAGTAAEQFRKRANDLYQQVNDSRMMLAAKAVVRAAKGLFHSNTITQFTTIDELRSAQYVMQRYIMAQPDIRKLYHEQKCDGYYDSYVDLQPGKIEEDHYDFRRVTNSILKISDNENEPEWTATQYLDELLEGDRELTFDEQNCILRTWDLVKYCISQNEDPTNIFGGEIGS